MEKREPSCTIDGNVNCYSRYGEQYRQFLKKLKIELPHDPAIPLQGTQLEKTMFQKDSCTPMSIVALFTRAKMWKQPKRPLTKGWIKKMWYI